MAASSRDMEVDDTHTFFWLVGLLEGEGYFAYDSKARIPRLEIEMKDEHVIARIAAIFAVSYSRRDRRAKRPNADVTYRMKVTGRRAMQLMKRVQRYMSPRRQRTIQRVEAAYMQDRVLQMSYDRLPLPPLTEVPYAMV